MYKQKRNAVLVFSNPSKLKKKYMKNETQS